MVCTHKIINSTILYNLFLSWYHFFEAQNYSFVITQYIRKGNNKSFTNLNTCMIYKQIYYVDTCFFYICFKVSKRSAALAHEYKTLNQITQILWKFSVDFGIVHSKGQFQRADKLTTTPWITGLRSNLFF